MKAIGKKHTTALMALLVAMLSFYASLMGVMDQKIYQDLLPVGSITEFLVTGSIAQDIISIPLSLLLAVLSLVYIRTAASKFFIAILGLSGYFFYGYGLYAIQGQYTSIYHIYLAIVGLSLYTLIWGLTSFEPDALALYYLPGLWQKSIGLFLLLTLAVLVPLWLKFISADIANHAPRDTYAVFLLDLCVVFPAFGIIIVQLWRKKAFGNILAGIALIKMSTITLSVAFGEWFQGAYGGVQTNYGGMAIFGALAFVSAILLFGYMQNLGYERG